MKCIVCNCKLSLLTKLFGWSTCFNCRKLSSFGFSLKEIKEIQKEQSKGSIRAGEKDE